MRKRHENILHTALIQRLFSGLFYTAWTFYFLGLGAGEAKEKLTDPTTAAEDRQNGTQGIIGQLTNRTDKRANESSQDKEARENDSQSEEEEKLSVSRDNFNEFEAARATNKQGGHLNMVEYYGMTGRGGRQVAGKRYRKGAVSSLKTFLDQLAPQEGFVALKGSTDKVNASKISAREDSDKSNAILAAAKESSNPANTNLGGLAGGSNNSRGGKGVPPVGADTLEKIMKMAGGAQGKAGGKNGATAATGQDYAVNGKALSGPAMGQDYAEKGRGAAASDYGEEDGEDYAVEAGGGRKMLLPKKAALNGSAANGTNLKGNDVGQKIVAGGPGGLNATGGDAANKNASLLEAATAAALGPGGLKALSDVGGKAGGSGDPAGKKNTSGPGDNATASNAGAPAVDSGAEGAVSLGGANAMSGNKTGADSTRASGANAAGAGGVGVGEPGANKADGGGAGAGGSGGAGAPTAGAAAAEAGAARAGAAGGAGAGGVGGKTSGAAR